MFVDVTMNGEASDMVDESKLESQDNSNGSLSVDAASEGNTTFSLDDAVKNEQNDMVPE